jgi:hypothetical protein
MYISKSSDEDLVKRLNDMGGKFSSRNIFIPFTEEDLPRVYRFAGSMCMHATISKYSTGIPLSRALLAAMVSGDTGVSEHHLKTIYLIEAYVSGKNQVEMIKYVSDEIEEDFDQILRSQMMRAYVFESDPKKKEYLSEFVNGFGISSILSDHKVTLQELYDMIGGNIFSKREYESWWRSDLVSFSNTTLKTKFLDFHLNHDDELIQFMRDKKPELRDMSDSEILELYHKNTLWNIASTPTPTKYLKVIVQTGSVEGMFAHSCCNTLDINPEWFGTAQYSSGDVSWLEQADVTFMTRTYTRQ